MTATAIIRNINRELMHYPGVEAEVKQGGKHKKIVFFKGEVSRFLTIPRSPSDWRAGDNALRDFKKTMAELGAQRLDILPGQKRGRFTKKAVARFSITRDFLALSIPKTSPLIDRFKTADNKSKAHWRFELRASPDLEAPPMLAAIECQLPPGMKICPGMVAGFYIAPTGGWRITVQRNHIPALSKSLKAIPSVDVELYQDSGKELIFKLPTGALPTTFKARPAQAEPKEALAPPKVVSIVPTPEPAPAPAKADADPMAGLLDRPITLQFPKQTVSVEQAITILNKAKARLGNSLRFTIEEGGWLSAVHRIGK